MDQHSKRKLENELMTLGLASLNSGELVQQFAALINNFRGDRHRFLEDALNQCDGKDRHDMYQAVVPHLSFQAAPLQTIEARIAERAGQMVTQRRMRVEGSAPAPVYINGEKYENVSANDEDAVAVATLKCKCGETQHYVSATPVDAMIMARKAGWVRNPFQKEECAACVKKEKEARVLLAAVRKRLPSVNDLDIADSELKIREVTRAI